MAERSWLERTIHWHRSANVYAPWAARYGHQLLSLRLGDFPAEPLYTLVVDGVDVLSLDSPWPDSWRRIVVLRDETYGQDRRSLEAYVQPNGDFVIDGQDLGSLVEQVFGEGIREYEWIRTVPAAEVPRLCELLGAPAHGNVLDALEAWLTRHEPRQLEQLIQEQGISNTFWTRMGD
jgi:hypothetical protein